MQVQAMVCMSCQGLQVLCWESCSKQKNLLKLKKSQSLEVFFQILMHDSYEQTNGVQLDFFTQALCWEYNKPKVQKSKMKHKTC